MPHPSRSGSCPACPTIAATAPPNAKGGRIPSGRHIPLTELSAIYNGIGPDAFPEWLRDCISALHPSLAMVALIHDVEWHESDKRKETFTESNDRFKRNGYKVAESEFGWYNPRRYIVMNQARHFGNICQLFGWIACMTDCNCAVCRKRREKNDA